MWISIRVTPVSRLSTLFPIPISHSLVAAAGWATLFASFITSLHVIKGCCFVWFGVISHWVLDFVVHRPDLPLYPGGLRLGLGLWNSVVATVIVEGLMYAAGIWIYLRVTRANDRIGKWGLVAFYCRGRGYLCCQHLQPASTKRESRSHNSNPVDVVTCFMGLVV